MAVAHISAVENYMIIEEDFFNDSFLFLFYLHFSNIVF